MLICAMFVIGEKGQIRIIVKRLLRNAKVSEIIMLSFDELTDQQSQRISSLILTAQNDICADIARRLARNLSLTPTAQLQLDRVADLRQFQDEVYARLTAMQIATDAAISEVMQQAAEYVLERDKVLYEATGRAYVPYERNPRIQQLAQAISDQTRGEFANITRTSALKMVAPDGKYVPLPQAYRKNLDNAVFKVASGAFSYTDAIKTAVSDMVGGGIVTVHYEGTPARPVNRRIDGVVRTTVITGVLQLAGDISVRNIVELEAPYIDVSFHQGARTDGSGGIADHLFWSGKRYDATEFHRKYG